MYRYQILIEYVGTNFVGWQIQSKGKSIQKLIQNKLSKLLNEKISIIGSGRTDSGVHAIEQSAHFDCKKKIENLDRFIKSINYFLNSKSISIINIKKKNLNFHARFSAKQRIYKYVIFNRLSRPSIEKERGWHIIKKLDINLMKKGAKKLLGTKDFSAFRASSCNAKSPIRTIKSIKIIFVKNRIEIQFKSQSFLQQQVRSMVGCLKYLAEKKWDLKKFELILKSKKRILCAPPAPPHGLFLEKVIYELYYCFLDSY
jgi:tRNA pseudouridine38-40 synthase